MTEISRKKLMTLRELWEWVNTSTFSLSPAIHFTYGSLWDGAAGHGELDRVDVVCWKCRSEHRQNTWKSFHSIYYTVKISEFILHETYFDSLIRAKLEPSGPHITWAILTSCLLDQSGVPSWILETPSQTVYSLRSGTLHKHNVAIRFSDLIHKKKISI